MPEEYLLLPSLEVLERFEEEIFSTNQAFYHHSSRNFPVV